VCLDRSYYNLRPNLYTILVSASGVGCKSTAGRIGLDLLSVAVPDVTVMRGKLTMGYLVEWMSQALAKNPQGNAELTIYCSEFKVFAKGVYDSSLIEDLTDLYDNPEVWDYRTKNQGIYQIKRPCVNLFGASTPEWLTTGSAADFIGGGFSSRMVPIALLKDEKQVAWPEKSDMTKDLEAKLITDLSMIGQMSGTFFVTQAAKDFFEQWYQIREKHKSNDARLSGYFSKKHDMVLKLAMILSAASSDDLVVTDQHIEAALSLLAKVETTMTFAYQGVAWGEQAKYQDKVLSKIKEFGKIDHAKLLQCFHFCMTGPDLGTVIKTLLDEEVITAEREKTGTRPKMIYTYKGEGETP
jgi:hypothetical protein